VLTYDWIKNGGQVSAFPPNFRRRMGQVKNELSEQHAYIEALGWGGFPVVLVVKISIDGYLARFYYVILSRWVVVTPK